MTRSLAATPTLVQIRFKRGLAVAVALSMAFLVGSAFQSAATLAMRLSGNDVMKAASGGVWTGQIARDIAEFAFAQVLLHLGFAVVVWAVTIATAVIWSTAREKFGRMIVGWFCLLAGAAIVYNAYWYPRTGLGAYYHDTLAKTVGSLPIGRVVYLLIAGAAALTVVAALVELLRRPPSRRVRRLAGVGLITLILITVVALTGGSRTGVAAESSATRPNVILLGIDSLRLAQLRRFGGQGMTPNLDAFLAPADIVPDTTTPVARTFPSWVAILTGRSPRTTGARFNLADRRTLEISPTIGDVLRKEGYKSIYATDEVRFANIDESYGFDKVVTPPIGASDFLVGTYNELPLASVVVNSRLGQVLFPFSYGNRGVATLFQPASFLSRLEREVSFDGPTLFITHLTASHWPYYVSDTTFGDAERLFEGDQPLYRIGLQTADAMFGDIVAMLERKGALKNAIVVVLSDHGEALGLPEDVLLNNQSRVDGLQFPLMVSDFGHGQSVLSPVQYQVLLGFRSFGSGAGFTSSGRAFPGGATVEDIAPTLLGLLGVPGNPLHATGESLAPLLRGSPAEQRAGSPDRVRYTETDLKVLPDAKGGVDEVATANQNSKFFEVDHTSGRMHIRDRYIPLVIAFKERAAFTDDLLLAAIPAGPDAHEYLLLDRKTGDGRILMEPPGEQSGDERHLWDAMEAEYEGELRRPINVTPDDLPAIDKGWNEFFMNREARAAAGARTHVSSDGLQAGKSAD